MVVCRSSLLGVISSLVRYQEGPELNRLAAFQPEASLIQQRGFPDLREQSKQQISTKTQHSDHAHPPPQAGKILLHPTSGAQNGHSKEASPIPGGFKTELFRWEAAISHKCNLSDKPREQAVAGQLCSLDDQLLLSRRPSQGPHSSLATTEDPRPQQASSHMVSIMLFQMSPRVAATAQTLELVRVPLLCKALLPSWTMNHFEFSYFKMSSVYTMPMLLNQKWEPCPCF